MKQILNNCSRRFGHDGWAVLINGATVPMYWTMCTTRAEVRELVQLHTGNMFDYHKIVKVKVNLVVV